MNIKIVRECFTANHFNRLRFGLPMEGQCRFDIPILLCLAGERFMLVRDDDVTDGY